MSAISHNAVFVWNSTSEKIILISSDKLLILSYISDTILSILSFLPVTILPIKPQKNCFASPIKVSE